MYLAKGMVYGLVEDTTLMILLLLVPLNSARRVVLAENIPDPVLVLMSVTNPISSGRVLGLMERFRLLAVEDVGFPIDLI